MLPTEDVIWVGEELAHRFGLPYWQIAMTATGANWLALKRRDGSAAGVRASTRCRGVTG